MRVLVTGAAGFIGSALSARLLARGDHVLGYDNLNPYYDPTLKEARLARLTPHANFSFVRANLEDRSALETAFADFQPQRVVNLAAQAGVRYSLENPQAYIDSNIVGFTNILEACRHGGVEHLVYASSSSVYGANRKLPFSVQDPVDHPVSLYAATKKANELAAAVSAPAKEDISFEQFQVFGSGAVARQGFMDRRPELRGDLVVLAKRWCRGTRHGVHEDVFPLRNNRLCSGNIGVIIKRHDRRQVRFRNRALLLCLRSGQIHRQRYRSLLVLGVLGHSPSQPSRHHCRDHKHRASCA